MSSTHSSLHVHLVFGTKERVPWITQDLIVDFHAYIGGCAKGGGSLPLAVGGVADHVHILLGMGTSQSVANIVRDLKRESSKWMKSRRSMEPFAWQEGYGAFSVGPIALEEVKQYICRQEEHHRERSFMEEYRMMLEKAGVKYDPKYLE
ncbi:REP element-mobilizing transposase RayT [Rubritalea squalenifaciens DSM 18772]|uniref:REP element-mobilizing transposase RayT n=1 Tax=Rubritalea squalenifaciens DSM 18772 TaxID=1123071 RepID=A0A1M6QII7_9BACT|nr:IS200/IS605 family transposase [Rubritalea squalenifaciens]SHK19988.1 REP element-mobilizing transposase RayT [Rubritalea squalenifaciens DSM 18772]